MSHLALQSVWRSGSSVVRTPLTLLPVWLRLAYNHTIRYGVFVLYWGISIRTGLLLNGEQLCCDGTHIHQRSAEFTAAAQRVWNGPEEQLTAHQVKEGFSRIEISQYKTNKPYRMVWFICSTGNFLSSQAASSQVLSTFRGLTTVFGMGTGGSPQLSPPDCI